MATDSPAARISQGAFRVSGLLDSESEATLCRAFEWGGLVRSPRGSGRFDPLRPLFEAGVWGWWAAWFEMSEVGSGSASGASRDPLSFLFFAKWYEGDLKYIKEIMDIRKV